MNLPSAKEYPAYYQPYIASVSTNVLAELSAQKESFSSFILSIPAEKDGAYAPGKWTIKEVIGHLLDTERILVYRALRFARNDAQNLPGFEENDYVEQSDYSSRSLQSLADEFLAIRSSTLFLFETFTEIELNRMGKANNNELSVRALLFIVAGHVNHHQQVIKERYLRH